MEAVELEMIPWILELRSAEPWLQQQKRLHAMRLGRSPCISLATEDHQLYANWAEMHSVSSPPYVELNEREASLGFHHAATIPCSPVAASARDVLVRALIRISRTQVSISGCEKARYIQLRNARVAKKADS